MNYETSEKSENTTSRKIEFSVASPNKKQANENEKEDEGMLLLRRRG